MRMGGVSPEPYGLNLSFNVGDSRDNVTENRNRFFNALGIPQDQIAIPRQQHTATIRIVGKPGSYADCDALITRSRTVFLSVTVADCVPIFLFDQKHDVVACVHAGWRGSEQQILQKTITKMQEEFESNPQNVFAFIGQSAGVCCYEVGEDVAGKFGERYALRRDGRIYLDLKKANRDQLTLKGIPDSNIEDLNDCTICRQELYHSYRRDREKSGRMIGIIGMVD